ncbi:MAG: translation initiation factor IF-2 subunit gamma [Candidatus Nanoarchaeia archaeon]
MKEKNEEKLPEITIGITGHVDHGKTTLTHALTGKWTMLHSEEIKRGITIKLGYADFNIYQCPEGEFRVEKNCPIHKKETKFLRKISILDAPGHETLMAVMLSGAAIIDGAILVISATEPVPQPQTVEHLFALKVLGVQNIIVAQNKVDLVSKESAIENYNQIKKFVYSVLGREVPIIPISAQKKTNLTYLLQAIQEFIPTTKKSEKDTPIMQIARSFDVNKPGTSIKDLVGGVIGGTISQGVFKVGDEIEIKPGWRIEKGGKVEWCPLRTKIVSISSGNVIVKEKGPGGSVAFVTELDPSLTKADSLIGNLVSLPGKLPEPVKTITLEPHLFEYVVGTKEKIKLEPFKQYEPLMLSIGTATTIGVIQSSTKVLKLALRRPVIAQKGAKVALARQVGGRWHLIGFGICL